MLIFWQKIVAYFRVESLSKTEQTPKSNKIADKVKPAVKNQDTCEIQREIRAGRKFSLSEAIGREGGSFMKGESAIPRPLKAKNEIQQFLTFHLSQPTSALATTLFAWVTNDIRASRQLDMPLIALTQILESTLAEPTSFCEFARQVAIAQSKLTGDRPYFQQLGQPPNPEADYTHTIIKAALSNLLNKLEQQQLTPERKSKKS